eukprot:2771400-Rhodomonas_salina.1
MRIAIPLVDLCPRRSPMPPSLGTGLPYLLRYLPRGSPYLTPTLWYCARARYSRTVLAYPATSQY